MLVLIVIAILLAILYLFSLLVKPRDIIEIDSSVEFIDGDTVAMVRGDVRVVYRDLLMDTPERGAQKRRWGETNESCMREIALRAKEYLSKNLKNISLYGKRDRYGRELVLFLKENSKPVAIEMVRKGLAFCYYRDVYDRDVEDLRTHIENCLSAEEQAKKERLGVWSCR